MKLTLNGESMEVADELTLTALLKEKGFDVTGVAAAVNQEFVSKTNYETTTLKAADDVEIVAPMQGG